MSFQVHNRPKPKIKLQILGLSLSTTSLAIFCKIWFHCLVKKTTSKIKFLWTVFCSSELNWLALLVISPWGRAACQAPGAPWPPPSRAPWSWPRSGCGAAPPCRKPRHGAKQAEGLLINNVHLLFFLDFTFIRYIEHSVDKDWYL